MVVVIVVGGRVILFIQMEGCVSIAAAMRDVQQMCGCAMILRGWPHFTALVTVPVAMSDDDAPMCGPATGGGNAVTTRAKKERVRKVKKDQSSRKPQKARFPRLLDMHAKEGREGETASEDEISDDDRDESDLSYVTDGSLDPPSPGMHDVYMQSLSSQAEMLGFGTPMHKKRHKERGEGVGSIFAGIVEKNERKLSRRKNPNLLGAECLIHVGPSNDTDACNPGSAEGSVALALPCEVHGERSLSAFMSAAPLPCGEHGEKTLGAIMSAAINLRVASPSFIDQLSKADVHADGVSGSCNVRVSAAVDIEFPPVANCMEGGDLTTLGAGGVDELRPRSRMKLKPKTNHISRPVVQAAVAVVSKVHEQEEQVYVRKGTICVDTPPPRCSDNKPGRKTTKFRPRKGASARSAVQNVLAVEATPTSLLQKENEHEYERSGVSGVESPKSVQSAGENGVASGTAEGGDVVAAGAKSVGHEKLAIATAHKGNECENNERDHVRNGVSVVEPPTSAPSAESDGGYGGANSAAGVDVSASVAKVCPVVDLAIGICGCNSYRARIGICEAEMRVKDAIIERLQAELNKKEAEFQVLACVEKEKTQLSKLRDQIAQFFE